MTAAASQQDLGRCPNPRGKNFPSTPSQKLPPAPSILRGSPLAGRQVLTVDVRTRDRVQINLTYPLLKFLPLRSSQTFTVDTSHHPFSFQKKKKKLKEKRCYRLLLTFFSLINKKFLYFTLTRIYKNPLFFFAIFFKSINNKFNK